MMRTITWAGVGLAMIAVTIGCNRPPTANSPAAKGNASPPVHDHPDVGPHKGAIIEWGKEEYHLEFTVDHKTSEATVYVYDENIKNPKPIPAQPLTLTLKEPVATIALEPRPQMGDAAGSASRFVGKHDAFAKEREFAGSVSGTVNGKPYAGDFAEKPHADHGAAPAPGREVALFLTPGGIYTTADIEKNGHVLPSQKFRDLSWTHDDDVKPGDRMCPVTANKADPQCKWYVNGQEYEFCCPPCLEKFVGWAKSQPDKVKPPEAYVK